MTDRFHVLLNLQEALKRLFERKQEQLKHLATWEPAKEEQTSQAYEGRAEGAPEPAQPAQRQSRREKRKQRYDEVIQLYEQGVSQMAIATLFGLDRDTVRRSIKAPAFPEIVRIKRGSLLDPYKEYLHERWATGQCRARSLLSELRERASKEEKPWSMTTSDRCASTLDGGRPIRSRKRVKRKGSAWHRGLRVRQHGSS